MTLLSILLIWVLVIVMPGMIWLVYVIGHHRGCMRTYERLKDFWRKPSTPWGLASLMPRISAPSGPMCADRKEARG